jgi:hypothetical protein
MDADVFLELKKWHENRLTWSCQLHFEGLDLCNFLYPCFEEEIRLNISDNYARGSRYRFNTIRYRGLASKEKLRDAFVLPPNVVGSPCMQERTIVTLPRLILSKIETIKESIRFRCIVHVREYITRHYHK